MVVWWHRTAVARPSPRGPVWDSRPESNSRFNKWMTSFCFPGDLIALRRQQIRVYNQLALRPEGWAASCGGS